MSAAGIRAIAHIHTDFPEKFGVPRQGRLADTAGEIVFVPEFRNAEAVRGLEHFSHIWVIWQFSVIPEISVFSPTVRPPRLGGNARVGVFASRSPFRPNRLGLSCLELIEVRATGPKAPVLVVRGADLVDGTPIFDIKPYLPYADCVPDASGGFASDVAREPLEVDFPKKLLSEIPKEKRAGLLQVLAQDPRPPYQNDPDRVYGFLFAGRNIKFKVAGRLLTVISCDTP